jgi:hypothetical protein
MRLTLVPVLTLLSSVANAAGGVPDQANLAVYSAAGRSGLVVDATWSAAQVVTAGIGGTLVRVELGVVRRLDTTLPLSVEIVKTIGPDPDFSAAGRLATRTLAPATIPRSVPLSEGAPFTASVDFSADNLFFHPDERFAIVLRSEAPRDQAYAWWANIDHLDTYTRGAGYSLDRVADQTVNQFTDLHFRTFVAVPETSSLTIASSFSALALVRRGRRRRSHAAESRAENID